MKLRKLARRQMRNSLYRHYFFEIRGVVWAAARKIEIDALYDWTVKAAMGGRPYREAYFNQQTGETGDECPTSARPTAQAVQ